MECKHKTEHFIFRKVGRRGHPYICSRCGAKLMFVRSARLILPYALFLLVAVAGLFVTHFAVNGLEDLFFAPAQEITSYWTFRFIRIALFLVILYFDDRFVAAPLVEWRALPDPAPAEPGPMVE